MTPPPTSYTAAFVAGLFAPPLILAVCLWAHPPHRPTLTLEDCTRACPSGISVFEMDRACYCKENSHNGKE